MQNNPNNPNGIDHMRLLGAVIFSMIILFGFHFLVEKPKIEAQQKAMSQAASEMAMTEEGQSTPQNIPPRTREEIISESGQTRIQIKGDKVEGSIALLGGRIDDLALTDYFQTTKSEKHLALLTPKGTEQPYYAEFGWVAKQSGVAVPSAQTLWRVGGNGNRTLTPDTPVTLFWDNGQGLRFERTISMDDHYMFNITQRIRNLDGMMTTLLPYQLISRHGIPKDYEGFFILHEGPIGFLADELHEPSYNDLRDEDLNYQGKGGWTGFTDKYWLASLIPDQNAKYKIRFVQTGEPGVSEKFQTDIMGGEYQIAKGQVVEVSTQFFAGAKEVDVLNTYKQSGVKNFDLALDFGMWFFITKPLFTVLRFLSDVSGHVGIGILILTVLLRALVFPLTNKSFKSMAGMKKLAPKLKEYQEKYKDNREKMQMAILELYQKEGVNPLSGCWPILLQIPIFFALYKVILIDIDMRHAPFWGWIDDMSAKDPTTVFNLFGVIPWDPPQMLMIGAWPCLMGVTLMLQRRFNPPATDPTQAMVMNLMPIMLTFIMAKFAAGLVIYWTWSNFLAFCQQYVIMRRAGVDVSFIHGHGERRKHKAEKKEAKKKKKTGKIDKADKGEEESV